jgi:hypothetical protein
MLNIVCVLKSGGDFDRRWVDALEHSIWDKVTEPHRFWCLTDIDDLMLDPGIEVRFERLLHSWPGWWSKIEMFRPGLFPDGEPILFFDLDTVILRDITHLAGAIDTDLVLLRDFYRLQTAWGSGVMGWTSGCFNEIFLEFRQDVRTYTRKFRSDQHFINWLVPSSQVRFWQDEFPGHLVSYKVHCTEKVPAGAHVVCFHGKPRPDEIQVKWMDEWKFQRSVFT